MKTCVLQIRLTPEQQAAFKTLAKSDGCKTVSEFILKKVLFAEVQEVKKEVSSKPKETKQKPKKTKVVTASPVREQSQSNFSMSAAPVPPKSAENTEKPVPTSKSWCGLKGLKS